MLCNAGESKSIFVEVQNPFCYHLKSGERPLTFDYLDTDS